MRWKTDPDLLLEAAALPREPDCLGAAQRACRPVIRQMLEHDRLGAQADRRRCSYGGEIVKETRTATLLYPTSAELHARLAEASAEISHVRDAVKRPRKRCGSTGSRRISTRSYPEEVRKRLEA